MDTLEDLQSKQLDNDQIINLVAQYTNRSDALVYTEHVYVLRQKYAINDDLFPLDCAIFSYREQFPLYALKNYFTMINDVGFDDLINQFVDHYLDDVNAGEYLDKLYDVFSTTPDKQSLTAYIDYLMDPEKDLNGPGYTAMLENFLERSKVYNPYAPIPDYIREVDIEVDELPTLLSLNNIQISEQSSLLNELQNLSLADFQENPKLIEHYTELYSMAEELPDEEQILSTEGQQANLVLLRKNAQLCQVYGPVNPKPNSRNIEMYTSDGKLDLDVIYGGSRMFLDMTYEWNAEADEPMSTWFVGYCLECNRRISKMHYAVREPYYSGGWMGCYCSWKCVLSFILEPIRTVIPRYLEEHDIQLENQQLADFVNDVMYAITTPDSFTPSEDVSNFIEVLDEYLTEDLFHGIQLELVNVKAYEDMINEYGIAERNIPDAEITVEPTFANLTLG